MAHLRPPGLARVRPLSVVKLASGFAARSTVRDPHRTSPVRRSIRDFILICARCNPSPYGSRQHEGPG
jgi:hypothetical protein